jgi:hypothetical protein
MYYTDICLDRLLFLGRDWNRAHSECKSETLLQDPTSSTPLLPMSYNQINKSQYKLICLKEKEIYTWKFQTSDISRNILYDLAILRTVEIKNLSYKLYSSRFMTVVKSISSLKIRYQLTKQQYNSSGTVGLEVAMLY